MAGSLRAARAAHGAKDLDGKAGGYVHFPVWLKVLPLLVSSKDTCPQRAAQLMRSG